MRKKKKNTPPPLPAPRSRSCQLTSLRAPALRNAGPAPPCGTPRTHTSPAHAATTLGTLGTVASVCVCVCVPPCQPWVRSAADLPARHWGCHRIHPAGLGMALGGSPLCRGPWRPRCGQSGAGGRGAHLEVRRELLLLHQPGGRRDVAGTREGGFAQLGCLLLRLLSHCKSRGERVSAPPPGTGEAQGGAGQDQALPACMPGHWGWEGAGTALCSWARSASSAANPLLRALLYKRL